VQHLLDDVRKAITADQKPQLHKGDTSESVWLGELGRFCEDIAQHWSNNADEPEFVITRGRDEDFLHYLQDALGVPYWNLMLDLFSQWRANSKTLSGNVVMRVLGSTRTDILKSKRRLLDEMEDWEQKKKDDIAPILKSIDARLAVLDSLWDPLTTDSEVDDLLFAMFERPSGSKTTLEADGQGNDSPSNTQNVSLLVSIPISHAANLGHSKRPS
jgi:hypothetical protein